MTRLFVAAAILGVFGLGGGWVYDRLRREQALPGVAPRWTTARRAIAARLRQPEPLEFGAVWSTHSGLICGVVNGWGSFGGLTGMTPFAVDGRHAVFALDVSALEFAPYWRECMTDHWITVIEGSTATGWCATRRGQARCLTKDEIGAGW